MKDSFLNQVVKLLNKNSSISFEIYKNTTIARRVKKRLAALKLRSEIQYLELLKTNQTELEILRQAIFINVSYFFRDKTVFTYLEKHILPEILQSNKQVKRFWVAGCATGEEVVSLVILILEHIEKHNLTKCNYKILASDIDEKALNKARAGFYSEADIGKIPKKFRVKYFNKVNNQYFTKQILKKNVIFAKHDLFIDPPFGVIDLVLCRNVLIYINSVTQEKIIKKLQFSLNAFGYLLLGNSESPTFIKKYFHSIDNKLKIFRKKNNNDVLKETNSIQKLDPYLKIKEKKVIVKMENSEDNFKNFIYDKYQPALILVCQKLIINHITQAALNIINNKQQLSANANLNDVLPSDLCVIIKTALTTIGTENMAYKYPKYLLPNNVVVDIICEKFDYEIKNKKIFSILIQPLKINKNEKNLNINKINQLLKKELEISEINLKETIQALEKSNQNFQSYNEELQSTNEEYLSVNEDLQSINIEYQNSINELSQSNHYLDSLMESTQIGTLFLDHKLKIKKFTKPITNLLNITEKDVNRPVYHFTHNFLNDKWQKLVKNFLKTNVPVDQEFLDKENNYYLLKVRKLKLTDSDKPGASVSFININKLKFAEFEIRESELLFRNIFEESINGMIIYDVKNLKALQVNSAALKLFGYTKKQFLNTPTLDLYSHYNKGGLSVKAKQNLIYKLLTETPGNGNNVIVTKSNGLLQEVKNKIIQLASPYDNFRIHIFQSSIESFLNQNNLEKPNSLFKQILNNAPEAIVFFETKTKTIIDVNIAQEKLFGYSKKEYLKILGIDLVSEIQNNNLKKEILYQKVLKENINKKTFSNNWILKKKDNSTFEAIVETKRLDAPFENYSFNIIRPLKGAIDSESLNLYNTFINDSKNTSLFFLKLKLNGTFLNYSDSFLNFVEYNKKELQLLKLTQLVEPKANLLTKNDDIVKIDARKIITKNQNIKYCNFFIKRFFDDNKAIGYHALLIDCTEETLKQQAFTKKINQFEIQLGQSPMAILTIDESLNIISFNKQFIKRFDYKENKTNTLNIKNIINYDQVEIFSKKVLELKSKKQYNLIQQFIFFTKNRTPVYCKTFFTENKVTKHNLKPTIDVFLIDETNDVLKQKQINYLKNKYESIFTDSLIGQAIFDTKSSLQIVNSKTVEIFGYTKDEFKKIKFSSICHPDDKKHIIKQMDNITFGNINSFKSPCRFFNKNGQIVYTQIYANGFYEDKQLKSIYHSILDVTKQKNITNELIENELKYRTIFNNSTYGILMFDNEQRKLLEVNKKLLQILGCKSKEELMQHNYTSYLEPIHIDGNFTKDIIIDIEALLKKRKYFSINFKLKKRNQPKVIYAKASFYPLASKSGQIFSVLLEDIDKQKQVEITLQSKNLTLVRLKKELNDNKNINKQLFEKSSTPLIILNQKLELINVNATFAKLISFPKTEIIGKHISRFINTNSIKNATTFLNEKLKRTSNTKLFYTKLRKKDASIIDVSFYTNELNIKNSTDQNLLITIANLSDLNYIKNELLISQSYLQTVLDNSFAFISRLDLDGNMLLDNKTSQFQNKNLSKLRDITGKPIWESTWLDGLPEEQEKLKLQVALIAKNKFPVSGQTTYKKTDNSFGYLQYALKYIKINNKAAWLSLESIDITDLVDSQAKLTATIIELESYIKLNLELEKFTFIASHDLKEPIRNIMSFAQLLAIKLEGNIDEELNEYLSFILNATKNLNNLIDGILEYSKFERQSTKFTSISVKLLLNECIKHFQKEINGKKAVLKIEKIPAKIIGDEAQLLQLFKSIISNAIKFANKNRLLKITIEGTENETEYEFVIRDNGIGIHKKYHKKIFLLFKKLHNKNDYKGIGLGLKVAQKIVTNHGGKIWVDSKYGEGSNFYFTLKKQT